MSRRHELLRDAVVEAARAVMAEQLRRERRLGCPADLTLGEQETLQTLRDSLRRERAARGEVRWDGRSSGHADLNQEPLPGIRAALYEAKSRIDHAVHALDTITPRGPGFIQAVPELNEAERLVQAARELARPRAKEQVVRGLQHQEAPRG